MTQTEKQTPWGFWPTIGFFIAIFIISGITVYFFRWASLFTITIINAPVTIGLAALFASMKKGMTVVEYLSLRKVDGKTLFKWLLGGALLVAVSDLITFFLNRPIAPQFDITAYKTAENIPLLWIAVVVAAPLSEEIIFRGFLFKGIQASKIGALGAVMISSLAWTALHIQYNFYEMFLIFTGGLFLGFARLKTNSIYPPIAIHSFANLLATLEVVYKIR